MTVVSSVLSADQITTLIQQATTAYQAPVTALQSQEKPIQTQISALGKVQSALSSLQSSLADLANVQTLSERSVTTSPTGAVTATAANSATPGTYNLSKIHLAQAENLVSSGFASTSGSLGAGSITIKLGNGPAVTVNIASGQDSLASIAQAINKANTGVQASVVYDGSSYHLSLTSKTGTANAFTVSGSGGLAGFSYQQAASGQGASGQGASGLTLSQAAANASFSLNGLTITSGSNTVNRVVPGLTFTLAASGSATVTVNQDVSALDKAANNVASALNTVLTTINQYSTYDPVSGAGPLLGDVGLQILRNNLLSAITGPGGGGSTQNSPYTSLSTVGFNITSGGTLAFDDSKFQSAAQSNYAAVTGLLGKAAVASNPNVTVQGTGSAEAGNYAIDVTTNSGGSVTGTVNGQAASGTGGLLLVTGPGAALGLSLQIASGVTGSLGSVTVGQGLYGTLSSLVTSALASGSGSVVGEITGLNNTITSMNQQIAALQQRAQQETALLTQQFAQAQATLQQLTTVSNFLNTYFQPTSG
jgi:flagellar hook-associated protein 2